MNPDDAERKIRRPVSEGKVEFANQEAIEQLESVLIPFMRLCYRMEPGSYMITDESDLLDLKTETHPFYVKQLVLSQYGLDIEDEANIVKILRKIYMQGRKGPPT